MSTTPLPLFLDKAQRDAAIQKHPRLWKRFLNLCSEQAIVVDEDVSFSLEEEKDLILKKMGLN